VVVIFKVDTNPFILAYRWQVETKIKKLPLCCAWHKSLTCVDVMWWVLRHWDLGFWEKAWCEIVNQQVQSCDRALASGTGFQTHSQFKWLKVRPESAVLQTIYLGCVWKWIRLREQNSAPESRRASFYSVKVIKMSRLAIDRLLILWSLHGSLGCCKTDCTTFLSSDTQDIERGQLSCARNCTENSSVF